MSWLTVKEAAERINVSVTTMHRLIHSGKIAAYKPGGRYSLKTADVVRYIESCLVEPSEPAVNVTAQRKKRTKPTQCVYRGEKNWVG